ncbi:hypothetical protein Z967_12035 [Clostridium novyi A str. 4540]|uniref:hypothetical protein n=1 Tax=Clostridium novyi TaxID=1542 RepID=UPI0004D4ACDC|nr:hypothetical protein [Clostridium novyi]KEH88983.1 hypothetical protein Z967_12035 [Clostridium novyi A str. 4540]
MLSLKEQLQLKQGVWNKYNNLDLFARSAKLREVANKVDLNRVDLNAKGQAIIAEIENMCCFPITDEEEFLRVWTKNGWTMEKFLQEHKSRGNRKFYNPFQTVSCRCN